MTDLIKRTWTKELDRFWMTEVTVDGIRTVNPRRAFDQFMVSYKIEIGDDGIPADTGGMSYRNNPNEEVSEQHWLSCGRVILVGSECPYCEEVANG